MSKNLLIKSEKIRELNSDEPIRAVLRYVIVLMGVNVEKHDKLVFDVIISTIERSFKCLEIEEIKDILFRFNTGNATDFGEQISDINERTEIRNGETVPVEKIN